ncbi:hypothetical protein G6011_11110 [Alternaria panax]|uniref:Uncharacterized protein n=1 Tax=Alternaria panax TaxID=48097 RepID=A0AAD4IDE6_9PLEO|nr:hypothetical protein G6011_11110 [Alternaria panax]
MDTSYIVNPSSKQVMPTRNSDSIVHVVIADKGRNIHNAYVFHGAKLSSRSRLFHDILAQRQAIRICGIYQTNIELVIDHPDTFNLWATVISTETIDIDEQLTTHDDNLERFCRVFPLEKDVMVLYKYTKSDAMRHLLIDMWAYSPQYYIGRMNRKDGYQNFDVTFHRDLSARFAKMKADGEECLGWTRDHIDSQHYRELPEPEEPVESIEVDHHDNANPNTVAHSGASAEVEKVCPR